MLESGLNTPGSHCGRAVGIGLIAATVMLSKRKKDSESFASLEDELKDAAQGDEN